ncbi:hypothetical protein FZX09_03970 [Synechococcus sp. MU1643]|uniref:hypothetical protein n=1 Tax=Synechococcus sp. MU1643 TaxID=2508349 RepID=UPI001CF92646|nr:hypothetical protein [Synechococcus sp. MU1643]MCB4427970.1 hypothetical protein [Synechococcus sp. MU1643]
MERIEQEAKARYREEIQASNTLKKAEPVDYSQPEDREEVELTPATSYKPTSHIPALRGDITKVTRPYADRAEVTAPSAGIFDRLDKKEADRRLQELEEAEAHREAVEASQPVNLQADLQAKSRIITRLEKKLSQVLKRLDALEGSDQS